MGDLDDVGVTFTIDEANMLGRAAAHLAASVTKIDSEGIADAAEKLSKKMSTAIKADDPPVTYGDLRRFKRSLGLVGTTGYRLAVALRPTQVHMRTARAPRARRVRACSTSRRSTTIRRRRS